MRVVTLDPKTFAEHCLKLQGLCAEFGPDLIVGIATGGVYVAAEMFDGVEHTEVKLQRPSTRLKRGVLWSLVTSMPRVVKNLLRMAESAMVNRRASRAVPGNVSLAPDAAAAVARARRVLVIDDAVDSGSTMAGVVGAIRRANPGCLVATAAVTVTTSSAIIRPDYCIYNNRTLIRFPWSKNS